jgi:hypothetical protein
MRRNFWKKLVGEKCYRDDNNNNNNNKKKKKGKEIIFCSLVTLTLDFKQVGALQY